MGVYRQVGTNMGINIYYKGFAWGCAGRSAGLHQFKFVAIMWYVAVRLCAGWTAGRHQFKYVAM